MKNISKRLIAYMLTAIMFLGAMPIHIFANPTSNAGIHEVSVNPDGTYNLTIMWDTVPTPEGTPTWSFNNYEITYQNITTPGSLPTTVQVNDQATNHLTFTNLNLEEGSLYRFSVRARFSRTVTVGDNTVVETLYTPFQQYVFLTDIPVTATGGEADHSMTVRWKVPNVNVSGSGHLFTHYRVHFGVIQEGGTIQWPIVQEVPIAELDINNGWATYTFHHVDFQPGTLYAVYVEPIFNNNPTISQINSTINAPALGAPHIFSRSTNIYMYDRAYISPELRINIQDLNNLALEWDLIGQLSTRPRIRHVELFRTERTPGGVESERSLAVLAGTSAQTITRWLSPIPEDQTRFWFEVRYNTINYRYTHPLDGVQARTLENATMRSDNATFDPLLVEFTPYRPNIQNITDNRAEPFTMNVTWEAFLRDPMSPSELPDPIFGQYLDRDLTYRIWITDNKNNFATIPADMVTELDAANLPVTNIGGVPHFNATFDNYVALEGGQFVERPLEENKIYYVRIQAQRNANGQLSQAAYGGHFIIPINNIPTEPNMLSRPPLRIKNVDGIDEITQNSITIEWEDQWFEVYDEETDRWYSAVGVQGGQLVFGDSVTHENNILMSLRVPNPDGTLNIPITRERIIAALSPHMAIPVVRLIDLQGASYQVHTVEFEVLEEDGFEQYLNDINSPNTTQTWVTIEPTGTGTLEHTVTTVQNPSGSMSPATAYAIFIRPFEGSPSGDRIAFFPSFVSGTTLADRGDIDITPVVPILQPVRRGGTYLVVKWEYIASLDYELRFSENRNDYPNGGTLINADTIRENGNVTTVNGRQYMEFTITGLFPQTPHYIWIRSRSQTRDSEWSNPIEMSTTDLQAPAAPRGLGIASANHVNIFNRENGTEYTPVGPNHVIVEWRRDPNDTRAITDSSGSSDDPAQPLYSPNIQGSHMLKFNDLIANRRYYVRVKTRLVIARGPNNSVLKEYTYVAQLSLTDDFLDVIEIEMPSLTGGGTNHIYMDSEWSQISVFTQTSDDEYDGNLDPDMVPLPERDFEIRYDSSTSTLTHRFRSNQVDANGNRDNNVDQRFISRLVQSRTFVYELDVSRYGNRLVQNRVVEVPFGIIEAFDERQIDFKIIADNLTLTIPHGSLITNEVRAIPGLNRNTRVVISLSAATPVVSSGNQFSSRPHRLTIQFIEGDHTLTLTEFNKPLKVSMSVPEGHNTQTSNVSANIHNENSGGWQRLESNYNQALNTVEFTVREAGSYAIITSAAVQNVGTTYTLHSMQRVSSKLQITDMTSYDESATIHANQFNQIIAAVARGDSTVQMNVPLSNNDFVTLGRSGMLVSGEIVTRQAGISSLVRLYEVRTGHPVTGFAPLGQTTFTDIANADAQFQVPLLKAAHLGFFRGTTANPHGNLTMGDLMFILDIILSS